MNESCLRKNILFLEQLNSWLPGTIQVYLSKYLSVLKNIFEVRLFDEIIPSHKRSLSCYFKDSFYAIISATRKGTWNTMNPLPPHTKLCSFFQTISPSQGGYMIRSFSTWFIQIYSIFLFIFEVMQWIKDGNSAQLQPIC